MRNFFPRSTRVLRRVPRGSCLLPCFSHLPGCGGGTPADTPPGEGTTPPATPAPTLSIVLRDSSGAVTTTLSAGAPLTVQATLKDAAGAVVPNTVISFASGDTTLGVVSPASALTNASGVATTFLNAASIAANGASQVTELPRLQVPPRRRPRHRRLFHRRGHRKPGLEHLTRRDLRVRNDHGHCDRHPERRAPDQRDGVQFTSGCVASGKAT